MGFEGYWFGCGVKGFNARIAWFRALLLQSRQGFLKVVSLLRLSSVIPALYHNTSSYFHVRSDLAIAFRLSSLATA